MIHWVREEAERGDAEAAMTLAECYMKGEGVEKNEEEALAWFRKAAEQGYEGARPSASQLRMGRASVMRIRESERLWH